MGRGEEKHDRVEGEKGQKKIGAFVIVTVFDRRKSVC